MYNGKYTIETKKDFWVNDNVFVKQGTLGELLKKHSKKYMFQIPCYKLKDDLLNKLLPKLIVKYFSSRFKDIQIGGHHKTWRETKNHLQKWNLIIVLDT